MQRTSIATKDDLLVQFKRDVLEGLSKPGKSIPCKYFYDERGSKLFEMITTLEEYYPTRTELAIMQWNIAGICESLGKAINLIEFGSGSSTKTELLLEHADVRHYAPIDISETELARSAKRLKQCFPNVEITPVAADYTSFVELPASLEGRRVIYFPGSTIGNFTPDEATAFLSRIHQMMGEDGALLIGIDLKKDKAIIERAYNDAQGVTAEFNLNLLRRINNAFNVQPPLEHFKHFAIYNETEGRIEMRLIAEIDQSYDIEGEAVAFRAGDAILTEYSHKYSIEQFAEMALGSGLAISRSWVDPQSFFAILLLHTN